MRNARERPLRDDFPLEQNFPDEMPVTRGLKPTENGSFARGYDGGDFTEAVEKRAQGRGDQKPRAVFFGFPSVNLALRRTQEAKE